MSEPEAVEWYKYEQQKQGEENWKKLLKNTTLSEKEYLEMMEKQLLEKSDQLLKRQNFI